jgi:hypothetical protein
LRDRLLDPADRGLTIALAGLLGRLIARDHDVRVNVAVVRFVTVGANEVIGRHVQGDPRIPGECTNAI